MKKHLEDFMKRVKKTALILAVMFLTAFAATCSTTGNYLPLKEGETVIGTVQTTFTIPSTSITFKSGKENLNTQSYVMLMEQAGKKYSGNIDLRDIVWVTGNKVDNTKTEIFATAKVIQTK